MTSIPSPRHRRPPLRRILLLTLAFLLPIVLVEVGVRALVASGRLPEAPSSERSMEQSWDELVAGSPADVVLLGDSIMARSIDPQLLAEALTQEAGRPVRVFNFAQMGASVVQTRMLTDALIAHGRVPPVVVIGVTPDLIGGRLSDTDPAVLRSPFALLRTGCGGSPDPSAWVDCLLTQVSAAWRWHGRPERVAEALGGRRVVPVLNAEERRADGFFPGAGTDEHRLEGLLRSRKVAKQRFGEGAVDEAVEDYRELVASLEAAGSHVVLLSMPYSPLYDDAVEAARPGSMAMREAGFDRIAAATGRPVVRVPRFGDWWNPAMAYDLRHLSSAGAARFTQDLVARPDFRDEVLAGLDGAG